MSGYESDKSSALGGSAFLDGDVIDDDDDTGSLTRQLAETAQGVREMSKQLGEYLWSFTLLSRYQGVHECDQKFRPYS